MSEIPVDFEQVEALGISREAYDEILDIVGRIPTIDEISTLLAMWDSNGRQQSLYGWLRGQHHIVEREEYLYSGNADHRAIREPRVKDCLAIATSPESLVTIISPTGKEWRTQQKYFYHAHKHLKRGFHYHLLFFLDNLFIHLYFMLLTGTIAWVVFMLLQQGPSIHVIALSIVAILTLILTLTARYCLARRIINYFGLQIPLWRIPFYEIYIVWHQIKTSIRYCLSNKTDYSTHKL